jgi:hypothetical protein
MCFQEKKATGYPQKDTATVASMALRLLLLMKLKAFFQGRHKALNDFIMRNFIIRSENNIVNDIIFFEQR